MDGEQRRKTQKVHMVAGASPGAAKSAENSMMDSSGVQKGLGGSLKTVSRKLKFLESLKPAVKAREVQGVNR